MKNLRNKSLTLIIAILLIAAFLRLYRIADYLTFLGDEGRDVLVVYNILHGKFTLLGPTASVGGFFMGPIYYYFMTPFLLLFNYNPVGPAVMVALFGIATVYLIYKIGSEFFGKRAGFIAASLYAIAPLVLTYSRSSWNPNVMPFFSLITLYTLYKALQKNSWKLLVLTGIFYGIDLQLHYIETFLGVTMIVYVFLFRLIQRLWGENKTYFKNTIVRISKDYGLIFSGFIVGFSPFLAFEIRHQFLNTQTILRFVFQSKYTGASNNFFWVIQDVFFRLFGKLVTRFIDPSYYDQLLNPQFAIWYYATFLLGIFSASIIFVKLFVSFKNKRKDFFVYLLLVLWFLIGITLFGFYKKPIYDYYFEFLFPLPFIFVGIFIAWLLNRGLLLRLISIGIFVVLIIVNLAGHPFQYPPNRQMLQAKTISDFVLKTADNKPFNFALIAQANSDHAYRYFFKVAGQDPVTLENLQLDPKRQSVTSQLIVVCETIPCSPLGHSLWEVAGFGRAEIVGEWDVSVVKVYKLVHYSGKE